MDPSVDSSDRLDSSERESQESNQTSSPIDLTNLCYDKILDLYKSHLHSYGSLFASPTNFQISLIKHLIIHDKVYLNINNILT